MTTTIGTLEKNVELVLENLTPSEKAKYVYDETWNIANRQSKGINEEIHQQEIERFFHRHVATLNAGSYIEFLVAEGRLNTGKWADMYFRGMLEGFEREDALLTLLICAESRAWITDYKDLITTGKRDPVVIERMGIVREHMKGFLARKREIAESVKEIMKADFWQTWKIERPVIDESENKEIVDFCEKGIAWMAERDLQALADGEIVQKPRRARGKATPSPAPSPI
ncbi:MAG: hypothetical protein WC295_01540 [Methanoregula sp.]|jgi:thiamine phosphate synthase YjbQ (UPF0047 family)